MKCAVCHHEINDERREDMTLIDEIRKDEPWIKDDTHVCQECAHKNRVDRAVREIKPAFDKLFDGLNSSSHDLNKVMAEAVERVFLSQHRYLQNEFGVFLYNILKRIGSHAGDECYQDQRNAWMLNWAKGCSNIDVYFKDDNARIELRG